jgi:hypothetical protein
MACVILTEESETNLPKRKLVKYSRRPCDLLTDQEGTKQREISRYYLSATRQIRQACLCFSFTIHSFNTLPNSAHDETPATDTRRGPASPRLS